MLSHYPIFYTLTQKRMPNQTAPGDVANTLVRYLLTQAGLAAGGLTAKGPNNQWQATLAAFGHKCAYTGADLTQELVEKEHAIAMNRASGGLHVYGNVIPSTKKANGEKSGLRYDTFMRSKGEGFTSIAHLTDEQREAAIARIEVFMGQARPNGLLDPHPELLAFYEAQYENAKALCATATQELRELLQKLSVADVPNNDETDDTDDTMLDLPSAEQFELEERVMSTLPPAYARLLEQHSERQIGVFAKALFTQLFADGQIEPYLTDLQDPTYSRQQLGLYVPVLARRREMISGQYRHYTGPFIINGREYHLGREWNNGRREKLESWLTDTVFSRPLSA